MDINTFDKRIKSEAAARKYLLGFCWKNHQRLCPRCESRKNYRLAQGRRRCPRCGYTFHDFSRRFINSGNLSCLQWLWLIKLFELDVPPQLAAQQLDLANNTVAKALNSLRRAILAHALDGPQLIDAGLLSPEPAVPDPSQGSASATFPLVFGVLERGGWVFVDLASDLTPASIDFFKSNFSLKTARHANIVYTDRYQHYDALLYCAPPSLPTAHPHKDRGLYIDAKRGFWSFAKERIRRTRGLSPKWFPFHLKELEFRYNLRGKPLFEDLVRRICAFVPERAREAEKGIDDVPSLLT